MPPLTPQLAISLIAIGISTAALIVGLRNYLRKSGVFVRGSFSLGSSRDCNDRFVTSFVLENLKDRAVTIFGIYLRVGHSYYIALEDLEDKPLVLRAFETYRKELGPIEFYAVSMKRIDLNELLEDDKVKKRLVLSTSDGKYIVPSNRKRWNPIGEYFRNHFAAVIRVVPSRYKDKHLGSNIKYVIEFISDNPAPEIVAIHPEDFRLKIFREFQLTVESLASREALEQYLDDQRRAGRLRYKSLSVHDLDRWRETAHEHYTKTTIKAPRVNALQHYALGPVLTRYRDWQVARRNRAMSTARKQKMMISEVSTNPDGESAEKQPQQCTYVKTPPKTAMTTDRNQFDSYLKQALHRDIIFRIAVWAVIASVATLIASAEKGYNGVEYFRAVAHKLGPLINTIGVVALLISMPALVLKDLEHVAPESWGQATFASWWGGAIRRIAGDLTLWLLSSFSAFFFAMVGATFYALFSENISLREGILLVYSYVVVLIFILLISVVNVLVRREAPPLSAAPRFSRWMRSPTRVLVTYATLLLIAIFTLYLIWRITL